MSLIERTTQVTVKYNARFGQVGRDGPKIRYRGLQARTCPEESLLPASSRISGSAYCWHGSFTGDRKLGVTETNVTATPCRLPASVARVFLHSWVRSVSNPENTSSAASTSLSRSKERATCAASSAPSMSASRASVLNFFGIQVSGFPHRTRQVCNGTTAVGRRLSAMPDGVGVVHDQGDPAVRLDAADILAHSGLVL